MSRELKSLFIPLDNDHCYYPLLYLALEETKGDIIEMGCGHGSTPKLGKYAKAKKRLLFSYENNSLWFLKFNDLNSTFHKVNLLYDWDIVNNNHREVDVVFIDHAPGDRRAIDIANFFSKSAILVCHDTEKAQDDGYKMRKEFKKFKYAVEIKTNGAEAAAVSNTIDLTKWIGQTFGKYTISSFDDK